MLGGHEEKSVAGSGSKTPQRRRVRLALVACWSANSRPQRGAAFVGVHGAAARRRARRSRRPSRAVGAERCKSRRRWRGGRDEARTPRSYRLALAALRPLVALECIIVNALPLGRTAPCITRRCASSRGAAREVHERWVRALIPSPRALRTPHADPASATSSSSAARAADGAAVCARPARGASRWGATCSRRVRDRGIWALVEKKYSFC